MVSQPFFLLVVNSFAIFFCVCFFAINQYVIYMYICVCLEDNKEKEPCVRTSMMYVFRFHAQSMHELIDQAMQHRQQYYLFFVCTSMID